MCIILKLFIFYFIYKNYYYFFSFNLSIFNINTIVKYNYSIVMCRPRGLKERKLRNNIKINGKAQNKWTAFFLPNGQTLS